MNAPTAEPVIVGLVPAFTQAGDPQIDSGAACLAGGRVCAVAEERLTRRKHAGGAAVALRAVLADCGVQLQDVSHFFVSTCGERVPSPGAPVLLSADGLTLKDLGVPAERVRWVPSHHLSHAYVAFEPSGFGHALVIVMDDAGSAPQAGTIMPIETRAQLSGLLERTTCFLADHRDYTAVHEISAVPPSAGSYGTMYRYVTDFLGLNGMVECGKTMALAAYGQSGVLSPLRLLRALEVGHITYLTEPPTGSVASVRAALDGVGCKMPDVLTAGQLLGEHQHLARHAQEELEQSVVDLVRALIQRYAVANVCLSGGVALNCVLMGKLVGVPEVAAIHVANAPGDTGQPLGNCLYGARRLGRQAAIPAVTPYLGPLYPPERVRRACQVWSRGRRVHEGRVPRRVAEALAAGGVIGIYHGRSELGPRALGHRSILADPRDAGARDYLNRVVKGREAYRPYGAAVLSEWTCELLGRAVNSPSMMVALPLSPAWRDRLPAVCHVDGTSRVQTVSPTDCPWFREIVDAFFRLTGVPAVLNTSFNYAGQSIVETPEEALTAFNDLCIDGIAIENWFISKRE